ITPSGRKKVLYDFGAKHFGSDGSSPDAGLIDVGGTLYGTTFDGGTHADGTVFSITLSGTEKVLHSFSFSTVFRDSDGVEPSAPLIKVKGTLYGTTVQGGAYGGGTVFSITTAGKEKVLHSFGNGDGTAPYAGLINVNGTLYGTTQDGGAYNSGTIFALST
ncbi:MAG: choice-of-anchor tandem repeat GloVer-containing protein, partial [Candidatus Cybelea sp.]